MKLRPGNLDVLLDLFDLALKGADRNAATDLVGTIRKTEGEGGTCWRFAQANLLIDQALRGEKKARQMTRADIDVIRALASDIAAKRPDWWGGELLLAEIAGLEGRDDDVIRRLSAVHRSGKLHNPRS